MKVGEMEEIENAENVGEGEAIENVLKVGDVVKRDANPDSCELFRTDARNMFVACPGTRPDAGAPIFDESNIDDGRVGILVSSGL